MKKDRRYSQDVSISVSQKIIKKRDGLYKVESETIDGKYYIVTSSSCSCPDFKRRKITCKHQYTLELSTKIIKPISKTWKDDEFGF